MPWLIKDKPTLPERLFFVHVPRCGGTSLMHHFDVPTKAMEGRSLWGKMGLKFFFHRYKTLETANFPIWTLGNVIALILLGLSVLCGATRYEENYALWVFSICLAVGSLMFFICLSFVFTAPVIGRFHWIRRSYLLLVHHVLCRFMESIDWCTGTNRTGYMMHLTAAKLLSYGYVSAEEMENVCSMAIVRNPYSRMVSVYSYNKFGQYESFPHFVRDWYNNMHKLYRETGEMDEWYTPCHVIPQFEFTHFRGRQLVQSIVKQEELKLLKTKEGSTKAIQQDSTVSDLPDLVRDALLGMPHTNSRKTTKKWFEYYDQETLDMTYEMYQHDFKVFNYSPELAQRTDLKPPALFVKRQQQQKDSEAGRREMKLEQMLRDSSRSSADRNSTRSSLLKISSTRSLVPGEKVVSSMIKGNELVVLEEGEDDDDDGSKILYAKEEATETKEETAAPANGEPNGVDKTLKPSAGDANKELEDDEA